MPEPMTETPTIPTEGTPSSTAAPENLLSSSTPAATPQQGSETAQPNATPGEKPAETAAVAGAPESYDFKAPDGQTYDPDVLASFSEAAKEGNLTQEAAQKLVDKMAPTLKSRQDAQVKTIQDGWLASSKADAEFGGPKLQENLATANKALAHFAPNNPDGTPSALRKLLDDTRMGNHPEVIRLLVKVGQTLKEDTFVGGAPPAGDDKSMKDVLYKPV